MSKVISNTTLNTTTNISLDNNITKTTENREVDDYWKMRQNIRDNLVKLNLALLTRQPSLGELKSLNDTLAQQLSVAEKDDYIAGRKGWIDNGCFEGQGDIGVQHSPLIGKCSALAPPLKIWIENGVGRAQLNFDWRFEGPIQCAHGGFIAAVFDEFLGWSQMLSGGTGATKKLTVVYHKPTPLNTDLEMTSKLESIDGRKIIISGKMKAGNNLLASAEGLFISFGEKGTSELHKELK